MGGTNTDAVLMDGRTVVGWAGAPTAPDVTGGITAVLSRLLADTKVAPAPDRGGHAGDDRTSPTPSSNAGR